MREFWARPIARPRLEQPEPSDTLRPMPQSLVDRPDRARNARPTRSSQRAAERIAHRVDPHVCYQLAVQTPDSEVDFVERAFFDFAGRPLRRLREDFCGTGLTSCHFVSRGKGRSAVGLDIDVPTLAWGEQHNVAALPSALRKRVELLQCNVLDPAPQARGVDCVLAHNFSYWILQDRATLLRYFTLARQSLATDGVLCLDAYGGWEAQKVMRDTRQIDVPRELRTTFGGPHFTYIWDQQSFNPITGQMACAIHFRFADGSRLRNAFTYQWRLWTLPEVRDLLDQAGFSRTTIYWEGTDHATGEGDGNFQPNTDGEVCPAWIAYIVSQR